MSNVRCGGVKGMLKSTSSSRRGVFVESSAEVLGGAGVRDRTPHPASRSPAIPRPGHRAPCASSGVPSDSSNLFFQRREATPPQRGNEGGGEASRDRGRHRVDRMARGAGEPSTKRARVDEADEEEEEEENPLVRRREEVVRLLERASAKGKGNARAKEELLTLCADFEAKNDKLLRRLPPELWQKILDENLHQNDLLALAMTCRFFREKQKDLGKKMETKLNLNRLLKLRKSGKVAWHTLLGSFEVFERSGPALPLG